MAEKATLLSKLPPVAKSKGTQTSSNSKSGGLLSKIESEDSQVNANAGLQVEQTTVAQPQASTPSTQSEELVQATEAVPSEAEASITGFQVVTYASFVLTFCMAGFAAVMLWRKSMKILEPRFMVSVRALSVASAAAGLLTFSLLSFTPVI